MDRNVRNNVRISIRHTDIVDTIGKVTLTEYEVIRSIIAIVISIHRPNLLTNPLTMEKKHMLCVYSYIYIYIFTCPILS